MNLLKVIFIGGLSNGKIIYDYFKKNKYVNLMLTITYPDDFSGARHVIFPDCNEIVKSGTTKGFEQSICDLSPDLIFVAGWSELISEKILLIPNLGVIGFHPSKLPYDRGRSVIAWQIEEGYTSTALTMFIYNSYPDGGDIIAQEKIKIEFNDYVVDILDKIDMATYNLIVSTFPLIRKKIISPQKQDLSVGNFRRLRKKEDSLINWNQNSLNIYNKIRAISYPYPGAETYIDNQMIRIWRAEIVNDFLWGKTESPGTTIAKLFDNTYIIKTKDSFIHITKYELT
jgi:methionyl-tRNA formyltransferase